MNQIIVYIQRLGRKNLYQSSAPALPRPADVSVLLISTLGFVPNEAHSSFYTLTINHKTFFTPFPLCLGAKLGKTYVLVLVSLLRPLLSFPFLFALQK
jgi:hypothetical protein